MVSVLSPVRRCLVLLSLAIPLLIVAATEAAAQVPSPPNGNVTKVLVFVEENHSLAQMQKGMPFLYSQARKYGYATNYRAITHPSLPNYLSIAGGDAMGVVDNDPPPMHEVSGASVFGAAIAAGKTATVYQEDMVGNCNTGNSNRYAVKHNPWAYYVDERELCNAFDVPSGSAQSGRLRDDIVEGRLPTVGFVTPNLDNDAHDGSLQTADRWLEDWLTLIDGSPDWQSGHLAVVVTADEDNRSQGNTVLTVVRHASQQGRVVRNPLTHYSLNGLLTAVAGTSCLRGGCTAPDMATAFALPIDGSRVPGCQDYRYREDAQPVLDGRSIPDPVVASLDGNGNGIACDEAATGLLNDPTRTASPKGWLDSVRPADSGRLRVRGWSFDPDVPTWVGPVLVYVDGVAVALPTDVSRPDVAAAFPAIAPGPRHGFDASLSVSAGRHTVCAYGINYGPNNPDRRLGCATVDAAG